MVNPRFYHKQVAASNFHSADAEQILAIRNKHLPHQSLASHASSSAKAPLAAKEEGPLLTRYREQYTRIAEPSAFPR